jgi:RNA polymerase sigma-70 factor (family 1)
LGHSHHDQDKYFFSRLKEGKESAFNYFFDFYYSGLCIYAKKYLNDQHVIEEIVQSIFMKLWKDRKSINIDTSVRAYFFRAVHNKCVDILRHKKVKEDYEEKILEADESFTEVTWETFIESELYALLMKAIEKLSPECRKIFIFSRIKNYANKEIAEKLNISIKTVENQMTRALKLMRSELKDYLP